MGDSADAAIDDVFDLPPLQAPWIPAGVVDSGPSFEASEVDGLLDALNEAQREACLHSRGPLLILAGPGSGKTRVVTSRIVHLITARGLAPQNLLAITFTNKAASEMRDRVNTLLPGVSGLWISTFHALCARILRRDIAALEGYTSDFSIYDTSDRNGLIKKLVKDLGYDIKRFRPAAIGSWISSVKNTVADEEGALEFSVGDGMEDEVFKKVYRRYQDALHAQNALDFDDLLLKALELFDQHPGTRDRYAYRFEHVMVDEYQDTNRVQYLLTRHLAGHHGNLAVCGDPDQSIYRWRGADIRNILDFEGDFPDAKTVRLEQNYRSTGTILKAASAMIAHNTQRKDKGLFTESEDGPPISLLECADENDEAREIAAQCKSIHSMGQRYSDIAVLYRMNFMQRALESALRMSNVPYQVVAGLEFYARREIRDLVAYLRIVVNPADDVAFTRVVNSPTRGVGATSLARLSEWASDRRVPLSEACRSEEALAQIRGRGKKGLAEFALLLGRLEEARGGDASAAIELMLGEIDYGRWIAEMDDGQGLVDRESNVVELQAHADEFDRLHPGAGLSGFLESIALVSETDSLDQASDGVKLMTLHACKGLEFAYVFIAGLEDELLPHARAVDEDPECGEEEERRLLYVGMTRARQRLTLLHASTRSFFGSERWQRPSPFLDEIPADLLEGDAQPAGAASDGLGDYDPGDSGLDLKTGDRVEHDHFGAGRIERLSGAGVNARATVAFAHHGTKELLLSYANLRRIS